MPVANVKLYMIPGTATDWRIFAPQRQQFPDMAVPPWLPPLDMNETVASYARRMAATIDISQPFVLGGLSFGGMIAQEMALTLRPQAILLISSCGSYRDIALKWRLSGKMTHVLPDSVLKTQLDRFAHKVQEMPVRHNEEYAAMLREIPAHMVRWQSWAATQWERAGVLTMPMFHIHGDKDEVVPLKHVHPQRIVHNGTHLINVMHDKEVNDFIGECLSTSIRRAAA